MKTVTIELFALVDADGNYVVSHDQDQLADLYAEYVDEELPAGTRLVKVTIRVPLPTPIELTGTVPDTGDGATLTVE